MGEALNGLKRTMMCGEPREINVGEKITLMGWGDFDGGNVYEMQL